MIITVSRQFGSGGRELGRRLADALGLEYYDRELVTEIARKSALNENYVDSVLESGGYSNFAFSFARTIPFSYATRDTVTEVLVAQQNVIKAIGKKGDCVIVGRSADAILADLKPVKIFVYADDKSKIERCKKRAADGEDVSEKHLKKTFKHIDKARAKLHDLVSSTGWGEKEGYDLMINTSGLEVKDIIAPLADLITDIAGTKR